MLKGRCRKCDHLFVWDDDRYSKQNHVINCKECGGLLGGGFQCRNCGQTVALLGKLAPESCYQCHTPYDAPLRESV